VTEKFSGFETKKNVAVRYRDREMLERILSAATKASIFDLIEVEYVVSDMNAVHSRLYDEAVKVIKQKRRVTAIRFGTSLAATNLANEKYDAFYPASFMQIIRLSSRATPTAITTTASFSSERPERFITIRWTRAVLTR
jgi:uncharacterized protein YggE